MVERTGVETAGVEKAAKKSLEDMDDACENWGRACCCSEDVICDEFTFMVEKALVISENGSAPEGGVTAKARDDPVALSTPPELFMSPMKLSNDACCCSCCSCCGCCKRGEEACWWWVEPGVCLCALMELLLGSVTLDMVVDPLSELMVEDFLLR